MVNSFDTDSKTCYFAIDKERSLDIIRSIIATDPVSDEGEEIKLYKHKLSIVEINLYDLREETGNRVENYYDEIVSYSNNNDYELSDQIDLKEIILDNDKIFFGDAFLHGTSMECDSVSVYFTYIEHLQTWFKTGNNVIYTDCNGTMTILNFNAYKEE
jgi:hypothetical protein